MPKTTGARSAPSDLTRDLNALLNIARGKASGWIKQREVIAGELETIRDTAQGLLTELVGDGNAKSGPAGNKRPGRRPGFKQSASVRRKIAQGARRRWATRKVEK